LIDRRKLLIWRKKIEEFWNSFKQYRLGLIGLGILIFFILIAIFAPYIAPYQISLTNINPSEALKPPSWEHPLGTDELGRDMLSLLIYGSRASLIVGFLATVIIIVVGTFLGLLSGYVGGLIDDIIMWITNALYVLPFLVLCIVLAAVLGPSIWNIITVLGVLGWTGTALLVRSQTLSVKEEQYVEAAKVMGAGRLHIIFKHILPNVMPLVLVQAAFNIAGAILTEAGLSFLGLGDPNWMSWGEILYYAEQFGAFSGGYWWYVVFPGLMIAIVCTAVLFINHALDEIINPRLRER
jgi:peptide/nickel transport system permease protein